MNLILSSGIVILTLGIATAACSSGAVHGDSGSSSGSSTGSSSGSPSGGGLTAAAERACALFLGCTGTVGAGGFCGDILLVEAGASNTDEDMETALSRSTLACLSKATDCATALSCIEATPAQTAACGSGTEQQCSGDFVVQCNGTLEAYDCTQIGQHCITANGVGVCGTGTCDPGTTPDACQGDSWVTCSAVNNGASGVLTVIDCKDGFPGVECTGDDEDPPCTTSLSETCGTVGGKVQCVGSGPACVAPFGDTCSGSVVNACSGGEQSHFDCASLGPLFTCGPFTGGSVTCVSAANDCTEATPETCADGVITYCLWGTVATLDCKSYGLSGCTTSPGGPPTLVGCTK
jgi:hypothetical protein